MQPSLIVLVALLSALPALGADGVIDAPEANLRLALVEKYWRQGVNDGARLAAARAAIQRIQADIAAGKLPEALTAIERLEQAAGITAGGTLMFGQRVYRPTPAMQTAYEKARRRMESAMQTGDEARVTAAVWAVRSALGDQAGISEMPLPGTRSAPHPLTEFAATALFVEALKHHPTAIVLAAGTAPRSLEPRAYASLVMAVCALRDAIVVHRPTDVPFADTVVRVSCDFLAGIQQPDGHLPTPDVRGINASLTDHLQNEAAKNPAAMKDGFFIGIPADGSAQFDNGEGGLALLAAAATYNHAGWRTAGLRAADWTLTQPCVRNFNYNAFSLTLCARAYAATQDRKYLDFALARWRVCIAPGQLKSGRWVDPHNAKTVYHLILLRAAQELFAATPATESVARKQLLRAARLGVASVLDEFNAVGVTNLSYAMGVLVRQSQIDPHPDARLRPTLELAASVAHAKSTRGPVPNFGVQPLELALLREAWRAHPGPYAQN